MTKYYETNDFKKLNRQWAQKLKDVGFVDIEDGLEDAEYLAGPGHVKSEPLWSAKEKTGATYMSDQDALDADHPAVNYHEGYKASYYRAASKVAAQALEHACCPREAATYVLLAEGIGDRIIQREVLELHGLRLSRYAIRKLANGFREKVLAELDTEWP